MRGVPVTPWIEKAMTVSKVLAVSLLVVVLGGVAGAYFWWPLGMCANDVRQRVSSPGGDLEAVVFIRNCGATTDFSTQVSVVKAGKEIGGRRGNVYRTLHPTAVAVAWAARDRLVVRRAARGLTEEERIRGVDVRFERLPQTETRGWTVD